MKRLIAFVFVVFMFFAANEAKALDAGVSAGAYFPMGDAKDIYNTGFGLNGYVGKELIPMLDARVFANYYNASGSKSGQDYELTGTGTGLMVMFHPPVPVVKPYAGAGYGLYYTRQGVKNDRHSNLGHGPVVQAGVNMKVLIATVGIGGTYFMNIVSGDDYGGFSAGLNVGIGF